MGSSSFSSLVRVMDKSNLPDALNWFVNDNGNIAVRPCAN